MLRGDFIALAIPLLMPRGLSASCPGAQGGKHFRASYLELWDRIVRECQAQEALDDDYLLDKVTTLIIGLNWCGPFLHVRQLPFIRLSWMSWSPAVPVAHLMSLSALQHRC